MKQTALLAALTAFAVSLSGQATPKKIFIDPASQWISIHDPKGSGAALEVTMDILKSCPALIGVTSNSETASYTVAIQRTGNSAGTVVIYADKEVVHAFKPGHTSTLHKVADTVCDFVRSRS